MVTLQPEKSAQYAVFGFDSVQLCKQGFAQQQHRGCRRQGMDYIMGKACQIHSTCVFPGKLRRGGEHRAGIQQRSYNQHDSEKCKATADFINGEMIPAITARICEILSNNN